jgi:hypothetical protein
MNPARPAAATAVNVYPVGMWSLNLRKDTAPAAFRNQTKSDFDIARNSAKGESKIAAATRHYTTEEADRGDATM